MMAYIELAFSRNEIELRSVAHAHIVCVMRKFSSAKKAKIDGVPLLVRR